MDPIYRAALSPDVLVSVANMMFRLIREPAASAQPHQSSQPA
jgi:hypothetical protein